MQLIHTTYTWPGVTEGQLERQRLARKSWRDNSEPDEFLQAHFTKTTVPINASIIGDPQPNVFLHHIIDAAFVLGTDQLATVVLANSDILLRTGKWNHARKRAISPSPSYDTATHAWPPKPADLDWLPRTFWIPRAWWEITKQFIPAMWFPAAWWEDVLLKIIPNADPESGPVESSTGHKPHPIAIIPEHQRPPSVKFNFAMQTGWREHHYHEPRELHDLPHRHVS